MKNALLNCVVCGNEFTRPGRSGPVPKYCSQRCKTKAGRTPHRIEYERIYRKATRTTGKRLAYEKEYNRRDYVKKRNRERMRWLWHNDPEFRTKEILRMRRTIHPEIVIPAPYSGHRWLDMARRVTGLHGVQQDKPWADDYNDDTGEAVLALLEGRDMKEAVREYRNKEYPYRKLSIHMGDWRDEDGHDRFFDRLMPTAPSAEDEYLDNNIDTSYYEQTRFNDVSTRSRHMRHTNGTPTNRRSNRR